MTFFPKHILLFPFDFNGKNVILHTPKYRIKVYFPFSQWGIFNVRYKTVNIFFIFAYRMQNMIKLLWI
ncbi:hypothetical protein DRF65_08760 [Chryseobacterium pennae]|uniref:Uncharacterized protein n=1 Tax=Chryseobacterium pennae TaxID=2258962 RepID=A0A3D9CAZ0_9FLAO|nr:hypothetical protein DRF65_08760 [Chryseobacterium pennae]